MVVASVHLADVGARRALRVLRKAPVPASVDGLRHANVAVAAPFRQAVLPSVSIRRVGLVAFWDDESAVERFLADHPLAAELGGGWHATLRPLRAHGSWPGLPEDLPRSRRTDYEGPAVVVTFGRLRLTQAVRFLRASSPAEKAVLTAPGAVWATAMIRPPFVATCSLWESTEALAAYAYPADPAAGHPGAIAADRAKPFHRQSAFVRFRPLAAAGSLEGPNPLPAGAFVVDPDARAAS